MNSRSKPVLICVLLAAAVLLCASVTLINLTTQVSGVLPIANGGTNQASVPGSNGQLLYNSAGAIGAEDPIVSYNYANLINAQASTAQVTGSAVRLSTFSGFGTLYVTFASITGTYTSCTLQVVDYDSLGNSLNNGSTISVAPANGTSSLNVSSASGLYTAAQMSATFHCSAYGSAGTISVDYVPSLVDAVTFLPSLPTGTNSIGTVGLNAGTNIVGKFTTDQTTHGTTDLVAADVTKINGSAPSASNPLFVTATPSTTGGWSKTKFTAQTTTVQTVKSSQGTFGGYYIYNPNTADACLQVFDNSGTITLGTTSPDMVFHLPGVSSGGTGIAANIEIANGVQMANAIKLAVATTCTGSTAPTTGLDMTVFYK